MTGITFTSSPARRARPRASFLFDSFGSHRDLHSFPTRRSSDLHRVGHSWLRRRRHALRGDDGARAGPRGALSRPPAAGRSEEHTSELHHTVISYAVFCLKKKKT